MLDFTNQVVLVTGAGSAKGMGRVIAQTFGKQGAKVVICIRKTRRRYFWRSSLLSF